MNTLYTRGKIILLKFNWHDLKNCYFCHGGWNIFFFVLKIRSDTYGYGRILALVLFYWQPDPSDTLIMTFEIYYNKNDFLKRNFSRVSRVMLIFAEVERRCM